MFAMMITKDVLYAPWYYLPIRAERLEVGVIVVIDFRTVAGDAVEEHVGANPQECAVVGRTEIPFYGPPSCTTYSHAPSHGVGSLSAARGRKWAVPLGP